MDLTRRGRLNPEVRGQLQRRSSGQASRISSSVYGSSPARSAGAPHSGASMLTELTLEYFRFVEVVQRTISTGDGGAGQGLWAGSSRCRSAQNPQSTGAGVTSIRLDAPAGSSCTATVTAGALSSFRIRCTWLPPGSTKPIPAEYTCGEHVGSSPS
jgi:hypothetical protein